MDLTQLLEEFILILLVIELIELGYHVYRIRAYEKKIDQHLTKMDAHVAMMAEHLHQLESEMAKLDESAEKSR